VQRNFSFYYLLERRKFDVTVYDSLSLWQEYIMARYIMDFIAEKWTKIKLTNDV